MSTAILESIVQRLDAIDAKLGELLHQHHAESPEELAAWVASFESIPAATMSETDWAAWQADRAAARSRDLASFDRRRNIIVDGAP